jgi:uncharacterized membrane protein YfcA
VLKTVAFTAVGFAWGEGASLLPPMFVAVVAGTYTGKWLLRRLSEKWFLWLYKGVLTLLAIRLILDGLG